jgi:DNA replication licensing factor MCM6
MAVRGQGLASGDGDEDDATTSDDQKVVYVLHPNCAVEEF